MAYQGSYAVGTLVYWLFTTAQNGIPTSLLGTPAVRIYQNSVTNSSAGVTLTVDYNGVTGQNQVKIDTSADGTFYTTGTQFSVVLSAGTVGGNSVVGSVIGSFDLEAETIQGVVGNITGTLNGGINGNITGNLIGSVINGPPGSRKPGLRTPFGIKT